MKKSALLLTLSGLVALLAAPAFSGGEGFILYSPKAATGEQVPASPAQGILVTRITVKRGDTLRELSRKHLGVSSWFPQVLLFNKIKNPDRIYTGEELLIPVSARHRAPAAPTARHAGKRRVRRHHATHPSAVKHPAQVRATVETATESHATPAGTLEQESYRLAKRAYLKGDYHRSLELFDSFLRRFPNSRLAADASLFRANCYLHLSTR